jgi:hypothetical protein
MRVFDGFPFKAKPRFLPSVTALIIRNEISARWDMLPSPSLSQYSPFSFKTDSLSE